MFPEDETVEMKKKHPAERESQRDMIMSESTSTVTNSATSTQTEGAPEEESATATMLDDPNGNSPSFSSLDDVISQGILSDPIAVDDTNAGSSPSGAITIIHWPSLLQSPTTDSSFSPSLPIGKSLHGLALTATVDRTKSLAKYGKRCSSLLHGGKHNGTFFFSWK